MTYKAEQHYNINISELKTDVISRIEIDVSSVDKKSQKNVKIILFDGTLRFIKGKQMLTKTGKWLLPEEIIYLGESFMEVIL